MILERTHQTNSVTCFPSWESNSGDSGKRPVLSLLGNPMYVILKGNYIIFGAVIMSTYIRAT